MNTNATWSWCHLLLLVTMLMPGWQVMNAGQVESKDVVLPWLVHGYRTGECGWDANKTISYKNLDNTGKQYDYENEHHVWGKSIKRDKKGNKVMIYIAFYHTRTLPPYAREDMTWQYYFCGGGDKTDKQILYHPTDSLHAIESKWNNHTETSSKESEEFGPYTFEEFPDASTEYDSVKNVQVIAFDNSAYGTTRTIKNWLLAVCAFHGDGKDGYAKVGLRTDGYSYNLYYPEFNGAGTKESPLQIGSGALLRKFATIVNSGAEGTDDLCAVLTADIDYTSYTDKDAMIGSSSYPYKGVFDGQGHTITLAIDVPNTQTVGLFQYVNGATLKNMKMEGSIQGSKMTAALVGDCRGSVSISNIIVNSTVYATSSGGLGNAGLVAVGNDATLTITNCGMTGSLVCTNSSQGSSCAGLVGSTSSNSVLTISSSYFAPAEIKNISTSSGSTLVRSGGNTTITNCYYTQALGSTQGTNVSKEQMASGEICWKLNGKKSGGSPWLQTIGEDKLPVLWDAMMVYEQNGSFFNFKPSFRGAGTELDPFQIENVEQLEKFRYIVNLGYTTLCAKLVTDIDLANRNWEPIGLSKEETYLGTFDGNGYVISNLSIDGYEVGVEMCGFFGCLGADATVKNLILKNVTVKCSNHAGTIAARSGGATILNCGVYGIVSLSGSDTNGLAYAVDGSILTACYTVYSNLSYETRSMTATLCYCGDDVKNKHASGELTYLLNNADPSPWVQTLDRDEYPQLRGAKSVGKSGDSYVNLEYSGSDESGFINNTSGKDFRVIHHGGRLYEFIITMATQDGVGQFICPSAGVAYSDGGSWKRIFTLKDVNADSLEFSRDWWGKIDIEQGVVYDTRTYHRQVPTFWIRQGNHTSCKQTSLLWVAPKELANTPSKFQFKGTANESQLNIITNTETTTAPDDASGLSITDPIVAPSCSIAGSQMIIISSASGSYSLGLWDATDNYFISTEEYRDGVTSIQAYMPPVERNHDLVAMLFTQYVETDLSGNSDTTYVNYSYALKQKPTHSILKHNIQTDYNVSNLFEWAIAFPQDTDVLNTDQLILARGYKSNYSDVSSKISFGLKDTIYSTTANDTVFGWYQFLDTTYVDHASLEKATETHSVFDTWNIPQSAKDILCAYQYPAQYLYYQAYRPTVVAMWSDNAAFKKRWKVLQREVLPTVDSVRITKDAEFDTNHKVTVRVILNNPYPWDVVNATDRDAVWEEAIQQQFTRRMFTWDNKASITLNRFSTEDEYDKDKDVIKKTITISGDQVRQDSETGAYYFEYQDIVSMPFVHYNYKAKVDVTGTKYPICESLNTYKFSTDAPYTEEFGGIYNLKATRGTIKGSVEVTWEADETANTTLKLKRREYQRGYESQKELAGWSTIDATNGSAYDDLASAAVVNEYILTITTTYRDIFYTESDTTYGYASYYGSLNGRVKMDNGVNMPGDVHVVVNSSEPFNLNEVRSPKGEIILPACQYESVKQTLTTDDNGAYQLDSVPYYGSGRVYTAYATCEGATFVSPTGSASTIDLTYEDANYEYSNIDFTCNDTKQFSGRILYTNSTVPVRDVYFKVNGTILRDAKGEAVVTDAMGNFSFMVPRMQVTIQAFRPGHKMSNDGYILGGDDGQQKTFTPTKDYDGLIIDDETRVRLVGRVAGGVIQGAKPLGFGNGKNNLGDSITLVLTLEGDHTSYLYFDKKNPDDLTDNKTFTQSVIGVAYKQQRIPTNVTFEAKRIVVKADNETGEFCLDLFPTKYVVSQIYAQGYSTLYSSGEGLTVLDLTDSVGLHTHYNGDEWTEYDGSFSKIYHAPVQVDLLQLRNNQYQAIYGAESMEIGMLSGVQKMQLSWLDSVNVANYALGNPVYEGGKPYYFMVSAYEPYYYNNITTGTYDRVPMVGYEVSVHNGLTSTEMEDEDEDDDDEEEELLLGVNGTAMFTITPYNSTFSINSDYNGLRYLSASVDINDYHYESEPIAAYVTGARDYQVEVLDALEGAPQILDYIRDPYGSGSYAYRTTGTTYNWSRSYENQDAQTLEIELQEGFAIYSGLSMGLGAESSAKTLEYDLNFPQTISIPTVNTTTYKNGEFTLELNEQLSTSDDPLDQGAIADVYLGSVSTADVVKYQAFNIVDKATFQALIPAIETGVARLVAEGENEAGQPTYLVICGGVTWQPGTERVFAYSQRHILHTLIPQLEARRAEALRLVGSQDEAISLAASSGHTCYYMDKDGSYQPVYPSSMKVKKDTVAMLDSQIKAWQNVIAENERIKYEAMSKQADMKYSVAGVTIEHTEEASTYYRIREVDGPKTVSASVGAGTDQSTVDGPGSEEDDDDETGVKAVGFRFSIGISYNFDHDISDEYENYNSVTGGSGYTIVAADNSYFDMDVYYQNDSSILMVNENFMNDINGYESGNGTDKYAITSSDRMQMTEDNTYVHNYIFVMRGGATREPWMDADYSQFYFPDGENSVALGTRTLKIDKPVLYIENPVINNLPQDEKAVFTIHLSNESELDANVIELWSSVFLHVVDATNPYGAKFSIDGEPLHGNMEFLLNPGESITKTLEVERGSAPYDYEDIVLELSDEVYFQVSSASISVHYLPTSTPVTLTQPAQNFLINTLSQKDEDGKYYIPVQIEGFSTTKYDNFDHIELQYKRRTDGEDQWINQCSYYANELLYKKATGNKAMIETEGKISDIRFYGEQDPVEQEYDLKAVSFCRLGNGFTTRSSSVISGTKDTRCPEVFGLPRPTDGILGFDDVISLPFTEPIAYNYLDETANFSVRGFTNNSDVDNSVSLYFSGSSNQQAVTQVDRVLNAVDFSVEMMVKPDADASGVMHFMTISDTYSENYDNAFAFGYDANRDVLMADMNGQMIESVPLYTTYGINLSSAMTHVGMTYALADSVVTFYVGEQEADLASSSRSLKPICHANGPIQIGKQYQGKMSNIRLWSKTLNLYEMSSKYKKVLSSNEANLLDYWPADEAVGDILVDHANGATIALSDVTWSLPDGFSVDLDHKTMDILTDQALKYTRNSREDYTIAFYFKVDQLSGDANLFAAGSDALEDEGYDKVRIRFEDDILYFISEGKRYSFGDDNDYVSDGAWHYVAVSVNHAQNKASLLMDGLVVNQMDADRIGGVTGSAIRYGDANIAAHFDQIQMWSIALPAGYIKNYYNAALTGKEKELQIYLPFERDEMNDQGTMYTAFSPLNHVIVASTGEIAGDTVINPTLVTADSKVISPTRSSTGIENLPFRWKSTENELQIEITKSNADINKQQLSLVVRRVEDLHGNPMQNAQMWTTYVNRNVLEWNINTRTVVLKYGQDTTFVAMFNNLSGREINYTLNCTCPFVQLLQTQGVIQPLGQQMIQISVGSGLAAGIYQTTVNLIDEDGLCSALTLYIRVTTEEPNWQQTTDPSYTQSMNLIGTVKKRVNDKWVYDMCPKDKVAAYIGKECVGVANISVDTENSTSRLYMTIRGKSDLAGKTVEFHLWDALTGLTYILETKPAVTFAAQGIVGVDEPVEMLSYEIRIQTLNLNAGWNWISLYVDPFSDKGLNNLFSNQKNLTEGDVFCQPFGDVFASYQANGTWQTSLDEMALMKDNVYYLYTLKAADVEVSGSLYGEQDRTITLDFTKSEWASMAYLVDRSMPIRQALSDFVAGTQKAPAGTIIKGYNDFAIASDDGTWMGSLQYLYPGQGYFVRRNGLRDAVTITYTNVIGAAPARKAVSITQSESINYPTMMPVVATFKDGDVLDGDMLLAMVGKEVIAVAEANNGLFYIALHAMSGQRVQFAKVRHGEVVAVTDRGLSYDAQGAAGTVENPYLIDFTSVDQSAPIYDIMGMKYDNLQVKMPRVLIQGHDKYINK